MDRKTVLRSLAVASVAACGLLVAVAPAHAVPPAPAVVGGDVIRHDGIQNLIIAKDIAATNVGRGSSCSIWNWDGGSAGNPVNPGGNCRTTSMNGRTYSWTVYSDTDAFTVRDEAYWLNMHGTWHRIGASIYTKINDAENAHCYRESDGVNCYVEWG